MPQSSIYQISNAVSPISIVISCQQNEPLSHEPLLSDADFDAITALLVERGVLQEGFQVVKTPPPIQYA